MFLNFIIFLKDETVCVCCVFICPIKCPQRNLKQIKAHKKRENLHIFHIFSHFVHALVNLFFTVANSHMYKGLVLFYTCIYSLELTI